MTSTGGQDSNPLYCVAVRLLRLVAVAIAAYALYATFFAFIFRMEGSSELEACLHLDIRIGFWLAFAFLLWRAPTPDNATWKRHLVTGCGTILIWLLVSGGLCRTHLEQFSVRAMKPLDQVIDEHLWKSVSQ
jgi:hypothetical protein